MTASGRQLDRLADLEEQRDFLLHSLDDLDDEYQRGDLDDDEYETLRDDYTRRAAAVMRAIESGRAELPAPRRDRRTWVVLAAVVVLAVVAGVLLARSSGQRAPGGSITGEIDRSVRSRVAEARNLFFEGDLAGARELVDEVLIDDRDLDDALLLSAQLHETDGEVLQALQDLDAILGANPQHIDALTLRGWILVRLDDPELIEAGIAALDAAIALGPTVPDPFMFRGLVAREVQGDLGAAIAYYQQALERNPPEQMVTVIENVISEMEAALDTG